MFILIFNAYNLYNDNLQLCIFFYLEQNFRTKINAEKNELFTTKYFLGGLYHF